MTPFEFVLLSLAAFRVFQLVSADTILDRPRAWLCRRMPEKAEAFITCPWCAGFWISVAWAAAFWADDRTVWVSVPFAISAVVGLVAVSLDRLTES